MNRLRIPLVAALVLVGPGIALLPGQSNIDLHPFPSDKGMWGFGTRPDDMKIPAKFDWVSPFSPTDKLAVVQDGEKYRYIKPSGDFAFDQSYDFAGPFVAGVARVKVENKFLLIDKAGKSVTDVRFDDLGDFGNGLIRAKVDGRSFFIDARGKEVFRLANADAVGDFSGGYAWFRREGKYGYVDRAGKEVISTKFEAVGNFVFGKAPARQEGKYGYIDVKGDYVIPRRYEAAQAFHGRLAAVRSDGKYGIINDAGETVIKAEYDFAMMTSATTAEVRSGKDAQVVIFRTDGGVTWMNATTSLVPVTITSRPDNVRVFIVSRWEAVAAPSTEALLANRDPYGNTKLDTHLDRFGRWVIICVWTDPKTREKKTERRSWKFSPKPDVHVVFE